MEKKISFKWQNPKCIVWKNNWPRVENVILFVEPWLLACRNSLALRPVGHCSKLPTDPGLTQPTGAASTSGALGVRKAMCSNVANKRLEAYTKSSRN